MPNVKPTIDPSTQQYLDQIVGKFGQELTAEAVNIARKKRDATVVRSHVDSAQRHLEEETANNRKVQAALVFGGAVLGIAGSGFITAVTASKINGLGITVCSIGFALSVGIIVWGIMSS